MVTFFFHGLSDGKVAEKFCHASTNREGKFVTVRVSMRTRSEEILSQRCLTMILRLEKRLQFAKIRILNNQE